MPQEDITIKHLLSHSSGLTYWQRGESIQDLDDLFTPYVTSYGAENPVGQFYNLLKVGVYSY